MTPFHLNRATLDWRLDLKINKNRSIIWEEFSKAIQLRFKATPKPILEDITLETELLMEIEKVTNFDPVTQEEEESKPSLLQISNPMKNSLRCL